MAAILGWTGTISYLLAYLLLSLNKLKSSQKIYHFLNIIGAVGLTMNAFFFRDYPNVAVNLAWGIIALSAVIFFTKQKQN
ncbi:CBU_0592 family membrane protein [Pollutibacter soli]|uniref:CBU_0592 family membrane protein n=1 Tax=Pollutibacter soli TaxID=3034157 RepID=UPI003013F5CC